MLKSITRHINAKLLLFCAALCLFSILSPNVAFSQARNVTVTATDQPIEEVIKQIEAQGFYNFFYNNKLVKLDRRVTVSARDADIRTVLNDIFRGTDIAWSIVDENIVLSVRRDSQPSQAAGNVLTGKVVDSSGQAVIGATIVVDGTTQGTNTNVEGIFTFPWSASISGATLNISSIGYQSQQVQVSGRSSLSIVLQDESRDIETVVVTALGIKREERAVTYNVQNISSDDVFAVKDANFVNALAGKVAGVAINSSAAGIGAESKVIMRGNKSIYSNNNALYVLDGIPLPQLSLTSPGDSYSIYDGSAISGDGISNINPDDIESMTVLTGPSAAALYGSNAANGVIMITTRTGEEGLSVTYSNNTTFMSPLWMPEFQNNYGQRTGYYSSWGNKLLTPSSWSPKDYFQTGYNSLHSLGLSVGGQNSKTYISTSVTDARGLIPNNEFSRHNFRVNHSTSFLDNKLHLGVNTMYVRVREQNMLASGQYYNPLIPVYLMSPGDDINKYSVYERYNPSRNFSTQYWPWGSQNQSMQNPYWITNRNMFVTGKDRFMLGASLQYDIADWINVSGRTRIDYNNSNHQQRNYASTSGLFAGDYGRYYHNQYRTTQKYGDVMVNINKYFLDNRLSLTAVAGASIDDMKYRETLVGGDLLGVANLFTYANMDNNRAFSKTTYNDQTQSVFATVQLGWDRMVYLDVTARNDWATALSNTSKNSIFYPSVGISGIVTDIFKINSPVFSYFKIRGSYAEVGNAPIRYLSNITYPVSDGVPQENTFVLADNYEPERTKSWEIGADLRLWGNKVVLNATYYNARTYNQIFTPDVSALTGGYSMYINAGRVDNKGIELSAEVNQKLGPVQWSSNVIYTRNKNKIVTMLKDYEINGSMVTQDSMVMGSTSGVALVLREGGKMGDIYVNTLKTDEHGFVWVSPTSNGVAADRNNYVYAGNSNPSYVLSWRNGLYWKGISLDFMFNARVGGVGVSLTQAAMDYFGVSKTSGDARDNGGALVNGVRIPAESFYEVVGGNGVDAVGAYYVYSMTNVRLGELSVGYDIPLYKWVPWIKSLNVSFVGRNLWMLYCKAPFDPEVVGGTGNYSQGIEYFQQPSTRNLGFSVKVKF